MELSARHQEYWRKNVTITLVLLAIWFFVTYVVGFFAREFELHRSSAGRSRSGWAAQGALVIYVVIIWFYARYMNRLDQEYGVDEGD